MRTHQNTEKANRIRHIRQAICAAVELHRNWIDEYGTDDDTENVALADILPGADELDTTETIMAATSAGFPVGHEEDGLVLFIGRWHAH